MTKYKLRARKGTDETQNVGLSPEFVMGTRMKILLLSEPCSLGGVGVVHNDGSGLEKHGVREPTLGRSDNEFNGATDGV